MKKVALVVGHSKRNQGASNGKLHTTEYAYNEDLALMIAEKLEQLSIEPLIVYRETNYKNLPKEINDKNPDIIISLHCNAYNKRATGSEVLYYYSSKKSSDLAEMLQENIVYSLGLSDRGTKAKSAEDRGGYLLRYTNAPCVIAEPFFIDNTKDLAVGIERKLFLVNSYVLSIQEYFSSYPD